MRHCLAACAALAAAPRPAAAQGMGDSKCPCVSSTPWSPAATTATAGGGQVLRSTVGSQVTDFPITHGLDGCKDYSAVSSASCADLATGTALVRRPPLRRSTVSSAIWSTFSRRSTRARSPTARRGVRTSGATSATPTARSPAGPSHPASSRTPTSPTRPAPPPPASPPTPTRTWPLAPA